MSDHPVHVPELLSESQIDRLVGLLEPLSRVTQPKVYGIEHLPSDGSLLVGNHTIYGFLDLPFMMAEVWKRPATARTRTRRTRPLRNPLVARRAHHVRNGPRDP